MKKRHDAWVYFGIIWNKVHHRCLISYEILKCDYILNTGDFFQKIYFIKS